MAVSQHLICKSIRWFSLKYQRRPAFERLTLSHVLYISAQNTCPGSLICNAQTAVHSTNQQLTLLCRGACTTCSARIELTERTERHAARIIHRLLAHISIRYAPFACRKCASQHAECVCLCVHIFSEQQTQNKPLMHSPERA